LIRDSKIDVIHCAEPVRTGIGIYMGSGGPPKEPWQPPPKCMGGQIYAQLLFRNDDEHAWARRAGIIEFDCIYTCDALVTADVIFAATGVTQGSMLDGIRYDGDA
jgi:fructose-1,6-bisphosphatase II / sedoheptulose-1,7-bisphosphatase